MKRDDVRESMWRVDPNGRRVMALRTKIKRRVYSVEGPLSLWHIDGHHKLIRCVYVELILPDITGLEIKVFNW